MQKVHSKKRASVPAAASVPLSAFVLFHLRCLQLFGLYPVSLRHVSNDNTSAAKSFRSDQYHKTWVCFHMGALVAMLCTFSHKHTHLLYSDSNFSKFNDALKLFGTIFSHFITLFETLLLRRQMQQFLQIYGRLHGTWSTLRWNSEAFIYRRLIFNIVLYLSVTLATEITYIITVHDQNDWRTFYFYCVPSVFMGRFRILQFILYLELLRLEVEQLNKRILRLVVVNRRLQKDDEWLLTLFEQDICAEIHRLMLHYDELYRMTELLKKCTAWSMVLVYATAYFKILSDCYWAVWVDYQGEATADVFKFRGLPSAISIFQLLLTARNCKCSTKYLAHNIHKLRHPVENIKIATRIQNFSLQLLHQQIVIDVQGFFVINCKIARDILGSLTTYMLFFVQFMPRFKNA